MNDLDPEVRALLDAARGARPSAETRARLDAALAARLGLPAVAQPVAPPPAREPRSAQPAPRAARITAAVLVGALAAAAGAFVWLRPSPRLPAVTVGPSPAEAPKAASVASAPEPSSTVSAAPTVEPPAVTHPSPVPRRPRPAPPSSASLDEELALLRSAQQALNRGDGVGALAQLDALAARHPDGVLREERLAARVLALCAAGRIDEARDAGRRFLAEMPGSVQSDRVRASCAFAPPDKPSP